MFFHRRIKTTRKWAHKKESLNEMCALVNGKERWKTKESPFIINIIRIKNERAVCDSREIKCNAERIHAHPHEVPCLVGRVTYTDTWQPVVSQIIWSERERELKQKKKLEDASAEFISLEIYQKKKLKRFKNLKTKSTASSEIGRQSDRDRIPREIRHAKCTHSPTCVGVCVRYSATRNPVASRSPVRFKGRTFCVYLNTAGRMHGTTDSIDVRSYVQLRIGRHLLWVEYVCAFHLTNDDGRGAAAHCMCTREVEGIKRKPKRKMISCEITMRSRAERERTRCICVLYVQLVDRLGEKHLLRRLFTQNAFYFFCSFSVKKTNDTMQSHRNGVRVAYDVAWRRWPKYSQPEWPKQNMYEEKANILTEKMKSQLLRHRLSVWNVFSPSLCLRLCLDTKWSI